MRDSSLQPPVLGFSGPPIFSKCISDVSQLKLWLALWQDDLFKSTFYLFHFVRRVCLIVCASVCMWAHETSKVWSVKEHLLLYLPQGQGFLVRAEQLSYCECSPHFLAEHYSHTLSRWMIWPCSASCAPFKPNVLSSIHMCNPHPTHTTTQIVCLLHRVWLARDNAKKMLRLGQLLTSRFLIN